MVLAGVLQGDPLSGSLFVLAIDPFLKLLRALLTKDEGSSAFADDIATLLATFRKLPVIAEAFDLFEQVSAMKLNAKKNVIVPLDRTADSTTITQIKQFLAGNIPKWNDFKVDGAAK